MLNQTTQSVDYTHTPVLDAALVEAPTGLPGNTGRAGQICAAGASPRIVRPPQPRHSKLRHDDLPKFEAQRRADWWAELPELVSREVTLRELRPTDAGALVTTLGSPAVEAYISPGRRRSTRRAASSTGAIAPARRAATSASASCRTDSPRWPGLFQIWPLEPTFRTAEWGFALAHRSGGRDSSSRARGWWPTSRSRRSAPPASRAARRSRTRAATPPCASWAPSPKGCCAAASSAPAASCATTLVGAARRRLAAGASPLTT